jgi:hypothetical protein
VLGKTGVFAGDAQNEKIQENRQKIQFSRTSPNSLGSAITKPTDFSYRVTMLFLISFFTGGTVERSEKSTILLCIDALTNGPTL